MFDISKSDFVKVFEKKNNVHCVYLRISYKSSKEVRNCKDIAE